MNLGDSLNKPSSFNGKGNSLWKEKIRIFIEGMHCGGLKAVKEGSFVLT